MIEPLASLERLNEPAEEPRVWRFFVAGQPVTQGHKTAGVNPHTGKAFMRETGGSRLTQWRHAINDEARKIADGPPFEGPVWVTLVFWLGKPKSAPKRTKTWPIKRGCDLDTAARAALDAITGVLVRDDAQVVRLEVEKLFWQDHPVGRFGAKGPGVAVRVQEVRE